MITLRLPIILGVKPTFATNRVVDSERSAAAVIGLSKLSSDRAAIQVHAAG